MELNLTLNSDLVKKENVFYFELIRLDDKTSTEFFSGSQVIS